MSSILDHRVYISFFKNNLKELLVLLLIVFLKLFPNDQYSNRFVEE